MPNGFKRVVESGITPGGIDKDEMEVLFPSEQYTVFKQCHDHVMSTIIALGEEDVARAPGFYMVLQKRNDVTK
jgi:hypothetical protein